jgi:secreted trypsin-like serine protease
MFAAAVLASAAIFHGTPAQNAPWFASLQQGGAFCSGSLIAPDRVLTAAHCVQGAGPRNFDVHIGGKALRAKAIYFPANYRIIPSPVEPDVYSASASINDIAIVVLRQPQTTPTLPVAATPPALGEATTTVGIGTINPDGEQPDNPLQATQQARDCSGIYPKQLLHPSRHLCTQDPTATKAQACPGDSGGAVTVTRDGQMQVAGVVTWGGETLGRECGEGPADVSERVLAHASLVTGALPKNQAPYSTTAVRIDAKGRCHRGAWFPKAAKFKIRYVKHGRRRGCIVKATTSGGWSEKESYNTV